MLTVLANLWNPRQIFCPEKHSHYVTLYGPVTTVDAFLHPQKYMGASADRFTPLKVFWRKNKTQRNCFCIFEGHIPVTF